MSCLDRGGTDRTDPYEPDDTITDAQAHNRVIVSGTTEQHTLCNAGNPNMTDIDTVLVSTQAGQTYTLELTAQSFFPEMSVGIVGQPQIGKWDACQGDVTRLCVTFTATATGTYWARISDAQAGPGNPGHSYSLSLFVGTPPTIAAPTATSAAPAIAPAFATQAPTGSKNSGSTASSPPTATAPAVTHTRPPNVSTTPTLPSLVFDAAGGSAMSTGFTPRLASTNAPTNATQSSTSAAATPPAFATTFPTALPRPTFFAGGATVGPRATPNPTAAVFPQPVAPIQHGSRNTGAIVTSVVALGSIGLIAGLWGVFNVLGAAAAAKSSAVAGATVTRKVLGLRLPKFVKWGGSRP